MALTPEQRSLRGQIAAYSRWAAECPVEGTAKARATFLDRFERDVDPTGVLDPKERARRAESAKKAHFRRLALRSAQARAARAAAKQPTRKAA